MTVNTMISIIAMVMMIMMVIPSISFVLRPPPSSSLLSSSRPALSSTIRMKYYVANLRNQEYCRMSQSNTNGEEEEEEDYDFEAGDEDYFDDDEEEDLDNDFMDDDDDEEEEEEATDGELSTEALTAEAFKTYFLQSSGFATTSSSSSSKEELSAARNILSQKEFDSRALYNTFQIERARYLQPQNVLSLENELKEEWNERQDIINRAVERNYNKKASDMKNEWMNRIVNGIPVKKRDRTKQMEWEEEFRSKNLQEKMMKKQEMLQKEKEEDEQQQKKKKEETERLMLEQKKKKMEEKESAKEEEDKTVDTISDEDEAKKLDQEAAAAAAVAGEEEEAKKKAEEEEAKKKAEEEKAKAEAEAAAAAEEERRIAAEKARAAEAAAKAQAEAEAEQARLAAEEQARLAAEAEAKAAAEEEARKQREAEDALLQPITDKATSITFAPKLGDDDQYLVGVGVRKKAILNIYSVAMYTSRDIKNKLEDYSRKSDKKDALAFVRDAVKSSLTSAHNGGGGDDDETIPPFKTSFLLEMAFKVGAEQMSSAIAESVEPRYKDEPLEVAELKDLIFAGVKAKGSASKGTTFLFECNSEEGLIVSVDGEEQGAVPSVKLASAFVDVYLDDKAASPPLKDSILQNCCGP